MNPEPLADDPPRLLVALIIYRIILVETDSSRASLTVSLFFWNFQEYL